jgi:hypothetical protein
LTAPSNYIPTVSTDDADAAVVLCPEIGNGDNAVTFEMYAPLLDANSDDGGIATCGDNGSNVAAEHYWLVVGDDFCDKYTKCADCNNEKRNSVVESDPDADVGWWECDTDFFDCDNNCAPDGKRKGTTCDDESKMGTTSSNNSFVAELITVNCSPFNDSQGLNGRCTNSMNVSLSLYIFFSFFTYYSLHPTLPLN